MSTPPATTITTKPQDGKQQHQQRPSSSSSTRPPKKPKSQPPITQAISSWLDTLPPTLLLLSQPLTHSSPPPPPPPPASLDNLKSTLLSTSPRRFATYPPLLLLPSGSFSSPAWTALLSLVSHEQSTALYESILSKFSSSSSSSSGEGGVMTHLAINSGIPPLTSSSFLSSDNTTRDGEGQEKKEKEENVLRSPTNLVPLYGPDFDRLWVSTKQNGLTQTWAPAHTMFSRGNVKEKARVLGFEPPATAASHKEMVVVDLYAGIGYFVFSYAKLGFKVLGWEINAYSVQGLVRGAVANKFSVRVVNGDEKKEKGGLEKKDASASAAASAGAAAGLDDKGGEEGNDDQGGEQIIVFEESNVHAVRRIKEMRLGKKGERVKHVNCGFLPTSEPVWRDAVEIVRTGWDEDDDNNNNNNKEEEGWLHLHENVGVEDIDKRKKEVEGMLSGWVGEGAGVEVEHVELVKTYAPGVWHVVFDVRVWRG
ncbi:putative tRNA wybutosine-synthesizing protein 2 [Cladorrhinum sp. PSN259]|nr:putative tRNA wybutosine-synthesizing protein 2 [Cladorrhinum sp. PSN259]